MKVWMTRRMREWRAKWRVPTEVCKEATFKLERDGAPSLAWGCGCRKWERDGETGEWRQVEGPPVPPTRPVGRPRRGEGVGVGLEKRERAPVGRRQARVVEVEVREPAVQPRRERRWVPLAGVGGWDASN
jgi:hypothetical protein